MKKYLFLLVLVCLACSSSSDEDNTVENLTKNRIKKRIETTNTSSYKLNFIYNGDEYNCHSIILDNGDYVINYFYENSLLTTSYRNNNREYKYFYENGNISEMTISYIGNINEKYNYFYNSENKLIKTEYYYLQNGALEYLQYTIYLYDTDGNNYKSEYYSSDGTLNMYDIKTFDNKNNVFKNFEPKISIIEFNPYGNNTKSITKYFADGTLNGETIYTYEYNSSQYPISGTAQFANNPTISNLEFLYD